MSKGNAEALLTSSETGRDRHDPGDDRSDHTARARRVEEPEERVVVEEELGYGAVGTGVELSLEIVEIGPRRVGLGMNLGVGGDADVERAAIVAATDAGHEHLGAGVPAGHHTVFAALGSISPKGHDSPYTGSDVRVEDAVDLVSRRGDAGDVAGHVEIGCGRQTYTNRTMSREQSRTCDD